ncbi:MAG: CoA pyrophosphatase [Motiliproteus sp.]|nr:CoA pyrophosphatase [Motiliproteus sp.]MCW9053907.1 CoA pyrophosphatase [Motiliproteus sp.]
MTEFVNDRNSPENQRDLLSAEWLSDRFNDNSYSPSRFPNDIEQLQRYRGDHSLNDGMLPNRKGDQPLMSAAVLVPIVKQPHGLTVMFTKRTAHLTHHPGQISFPGGRSEPHDISAVATALRETEEEVGIPTDWVDILGHLDDYVTRTGFVVTPVVGLLEPAYPQSPDPFEVEEVFEVPLEFLLDSSNHQRCSRVLDGQPRHFYAMPYNDHFIWGATAGMLINLYQFLTGEDPL